jgi:diguanylate cyclase (GGDEF)-like protein
MFDNNIYAFLLLSILLFVVIVKKDIYDYSRKLFYRMIIINMILLIVEVLAWAFDGITTSEAGIANYVFNILLILFEPIMASMWLSYVDYKINRSIERLKKRLFYLHASVFSGILLIINIFTPVAFTIDDNNIYHRGSLLWLSLVFVFGLVLYTIVIAIKNRETISDRMIFFIAAFALLPVLVSFIQLFIYGLILTWAVVALGVVFAYYLLEIAGNSVDYLTGLSSRKKIEEIITGCIENKENFTVIMLDLENFKTINDKYGHKKGDETLIHLSKVLLKTFGKSNFVSRIGGDEFLIVIRDSMAQDKEYYRERLLKEVDAYRPFDLLKHIGYSVGVKEFIPDLNLSIDTILDDVDKLMYENKSKNKNFKRRKTDNIDTL